MPVTAKLSSRFYEKLGDDVTNELVTWLNAVDTEFRNELREANDRNWDRFEAKLEALAARLTGEFKTGLAELRAEQLRWMFGYWATTLLVIAGLKLL